MHIYLYLIPHERSVNISDNLHTMLQQMPSSLSQDYLSVLLTPCSSILTAQPETVSRSHRCRRAQPISALSD